MFFFVSLSYCLFDNVPPEYKISNNIKLSNKIWPNYGKKLVSYGICYAFNFPLTFQRQSLLGVQSIIWGPILVLTLYNGRTKSIATTLKNQQEASSMKRAEWFIETASLFKLTVENMGLD